MFKKIFALATVLCVIPMMASAATWRLGTWAKSQGGSIDSRNKTGQVVANGAIYRSYSTANNSTVTITPAAGFKISKLERNGIVSVPAPGVYSEIPSGTGNLNLFATFARIAYTLQATALANGSVDKGSYSPVYAGYQSPAKSFIFTPAPGFAVTGINASAGVDGVNYQLLNAVTGQPSALGIVGVKVKVNVVDVPAGGVSFTASFGGTAIETPAVPSANCENCHATQGVGAGVYASYTSSVHKNNNVQCYGCHAGANTGGHPGTVQCATCHAGVTDGHVAAKICIGCHATSSDVHGITAAVPSITLAAPQHYGGTAFLAAQYVSDASLPVSCTNCHGDPVTHTANLAIRKQFAASAHSDPLAEAWRHYDWRSSSRIACQRCHAGTAFVATLGNENNTTNAYQPTDILKPGEVLNCSACHTSTDTGALRTAAQGFTINMTNGATVTYDVVGASTLCARCHSGRETGDSIKADTSTTGVLGYIFNPHYLPAAATLYNKGGYEYAGQSYDGLGLHSTVGTGESGQGPCVTCHMGLGTANHSWKVATSNGCGACHSNPTAANLAIAKANYDAALDSLRLALEARGVYYAAAHPNFFTAAYNPAGANTPFTNWAGVYGLSSWKNVMGAAFNYNLLVNEPAAYAHNKQYALKLIADSCDFLADGSVDGAGIPAAVTTVMNTIAFPLK